MLSAAVYLARWAWDVVRYVSAWLAYKSFALILIAVVLPVVLRKFFAWSWNFLAAHGINALEYVFGWIDQAMIDAGIAVDVNLTGVGGYIASQVGLIEYCSVIITGWALVWVIAIGMRSSALVRT